MEATGLGWLDVARPHESDDVDPQGLYHTFEWALRRKKDGDCAFLEDGRCTIYAYRPFICRTYPMRLEGAELELYECDGLGTGAMGNDEARAMAEALLKRQVVEAEEAISLLEKYDAYCPSATASCPGRVYVVHDSEGSRKVAERSAGSFYFI
jgi:Fe-S-cluster containining protein